MRYWWVNHKQTSKFEIAGGFLWSPKHKANGSRNQFYDNMRLASPGDAVISFSHAQIRHVGVVTDFAITAQKPVSFGSAGENWNINNGWLLLVKWEPLAIPVRPKQRIDELGEMLPKKYSPIHPITGNGGQNAYLAEIGKPVFDLLTGFSNLRADPSLLLMTAAPGFLKETDDAIEKDILEDGKLEITVKKQIIAARRGQGIFKDRVYEFERCCRVTKISTPGFLIASHIKPWRLCNTALERLDGANGLLLTPNADFLFDRGFITFKDDGVIKFSTRLEVLDLDRLGFLGSTTDIYKPFHERQLKYLDFHREQIFLG